LERRLARRGLRPAERRRADRRHDGQHRAAGDDSPGHAARLLLLRGGCGRRRHHRGAEREQSRRERRAGPGRPRPDGDGGFHGDGAVDEADEANNERLTAGVLNLLRPDLTVPSVTFTPAATRPNGSVTVTYTVKNVASAPGNAPASLGHLYLASSNSGVASPV